jgi:hypothetical protein
VPGFEVPSKTRPAPAAGSQGFPDVQPVTGFRVRDDLAQAIDE